MKAEHISSKKSRKGFTLTEVIVSAAIFGILLAALTQLFSTGARTSQDQLLGAEANEVSQQAFLRITDVLLQAHYIYPAGQTINVSFSDGGTSSTRTFVTGSSVLALLVPAGTTYCTSTDKEYCGFLYSVESRDNYTTVLPDSAYGNSAIIEWRANDLIWARNAVPANNLNVWSNATTGIIVDSVESIQTDLASAARLSMSNEDPIYDEVDNFSRVSGDENKANGLIIGVKPQIAIRYDDGTSDVNTKTTYTFSRAIPRATYPNP